MNFENKKREKEQILGNLWYPNLSFCTPCNEKDCFQRAQLENFLKIILIYNKF